MKYTKWSWSKCHSIIINYDAAGPDIDILQCGINIADDDIQYIIFQIHNYCYKLLEYFVSAGWYNILGNLNIILKVL